MRLELLAKLADESLYELYAARVVTDEGTGLVSARKLKPACVNEKGLLDALGNAVSGVSLPYSDLLLAPLGMFSAGGDYWWLSRRTPGFDVETIIGRLASREVRISPVNVLQIGIDFLQGLSSIHELGSTHGGICPKNILVDLDGVTRLDGLIFDATMLGVKNLRKTHRKGIRLYLAPELSQSRAQDISGDVFASAAVLYHLLAGSAPLEGKVGVSTRHQAIKPPSKVNRSLPYSCDAVFIKALANSPRQRHDSIHALYNAIKRLRKSLLSGGDNGRKSLSLFLKNLYPNEAKVFGTASSIQRPAISKPVLLEPVSLERMVNGAPGAVVSASLDTEPGAAPLADQSKPDRGPDEISFINEESGDLGFPERALPLQESSSSSSSFDPHASTDIEPVDLKPFSARASGPKGRPQADPILESAPGGNRGQTARMRQAFVDEQEAGNRANLENAEEGLEYRDSPSGIRTDESSVSETGQSPQGLSESIPGGKRPAFIVAAVILGVTFLMLILLLSGVLSSNFELRPVGPPEGRASLIGFLSLNAAPGSKVIMDGEELTDPMPLIRKLVPAGTHRLQVFTKSGVQLMDDKVLVQSGEHKEIHLVVPKVRRSEPAATTKKRSITSRKRHVYHRRAKRSKSRSRSKHKTRKRTRR